MRAHAALKDQESRRVLHGPPTPLGSHATTVLRAVRGVWHS